MPHRFTKGNAMAMDFGIFVLMQHRDQNKTSRQIIKETIEQVRTADRLGFGAAWFAEHHFNNYCLCPSPLMMVGHCAGVTEQIRLGSAVVVTPLYNPPRLIEEIAMADQLSDGRLNVGVGGGYQQYEFERFGTTLENAKERTIETLDMIELGLTQKKFSYQGKHLSQPTSAISVRPVQTPIPPVWVATADPALMRRAIARDHHVFISGWLGGPKLLTGFRQQIDTLAAEQGKAPDDVKVGFLRFAFASDKPSEVQHYLDCARYQQRIAVSLKTRTECMEDDYMVQEQPFEQEISLEKMAENLPVGSVDTVIERMVRDLRIVRPVHVAIQTQIGDMDHQTMLRQLELWSKVIIPTVQQELARNPAPAAEPAMAAVAG
jgi:alkanesulfonate monooxygenase SsuD/methylene tetrahydromethanopterin reductase-like flavin-dependent oxidoreductase (luciferase family)